MKKDPIVTGTSCPGCGREFKNPQAVRGHLRFCPSRAAVVDTQAPAPAFVAEVKPEPAPAPAEPVPMPAAAPPAARTAPPAFVAEVAVPPPPPTPPAAAETTQYVPRMPLPNPAAGPGGTPLEQWSPVQAFPNQLPELHPAPPAPEAPAQAEVEPSSATVTVATAGQSPQPGTQLAVPTAPAPAVDIVRVMQVLSARMFTWEGSGALTDEEVELLRQVITWKPGPTSGFFVVVTAVFLPRLVTHPKVAAIIGRAFEAGVDKLLEALEGAAQAPATPAAAAPTARAEPQAAPAPVTPPAAANDAADIRAAWAAQGVNYDEVMAQRAARAREAA